MRDEKASLEAKENAINGTLGANKEWIQMAILQLQELAKTTNTLGYTGEDFRYYLKPFIGEPTHHNTWGALTRALLSKKFIKPNGEYRISADVKAHGRRINVYHFTQLIQDFVDESID